MEPWDVDDRARELLENVCGFPIGGTPSGLSMLPESDELECVAGDGSGGCFYVWHAQRRGDRVPVVYLSSYGEASQFAEDFATALTIVSAFPGYWGDMLVAAHKGDEVLFRCWSHYEAGVRPERAEARDELCALLKIEPAVAPAKLAAAVREVPAFAPMLFADRGRAPASSFKDRTAPA